MRTAVFIVFCLVLNSAIAQTSSSGRTLPSEFNCEELTSHVQTLKESARSKKEKFSCILNLLKSAITDELETPHCLEEINDMNLLNNEVEEKVTNAINQSVPENETENTNGDERELYNKLVPKTTRDKTKNNAHNLEVPTMIPIFKPRPVIRNEFENINTARPRSISVAPKAVHANSNSISNAPKFTIPCQRAADILDMSVALPREVTVKHVETVQPNMKPKPKDTRSLWANQTPSTVSLHCADSDESVAILFKPKAISLIQVYGNLLKKMTITVLIPYHMSKMGQR